MASKTDAGPSSTKVLADVPSNPDNAGAWFGPFTVTVIVAVAVLLPPVPACELSLRVRVSVSNPLKFKSG